MINENGKNEILGGKLQKPAGLKPCYMCGLEPVALFYESFYLEETGKTGNYYVIFCPECSSNESYLFGWLRALDPKRKIERAEKAVSLYWNERNTNPTKE